MVLSDQSMPKLTGTEFLGRVKQLYPQTVRLLFSAYRNFELAIAAINLGAVHHFLTKPWNPNEMNQLIAPSLHYSCTHGMEEPRMFKRTSPFVMQKGSDELGCIHSRKLITWSMSTKRNPKNSHAHRKTDRLSRSTEPARST